MDTWRKLVAIKEAVPKLYLAAQTSFDDRLTINTNGSLEIASLKPEDETEYRCKVKQEGNMDFHLIQLRVACDGEFSLKKVIENGVRPTQF